MAIQEINDQALAAVYDACWQQGEQLTQPTLLSSIDFTDPRYDSLALGALRSEKISDQQRIGIVDKLDKQLFQIGIQIDENRVGSYLSAACDIFRNKEESPELKAKLEGLMTTDRMEKLAHDSARDRWKWQNAEAALHAYTTFLSIDNLYGKETGKKIKENLVKELSFAREFDIACDRAAFQQGLEAPPRTVISLGVQGAEVAQIGLKHGLLSATDELKVRPHISPYYRDRALVMGDPDKGFMTPQQILSELIRVEGAARGAGVELAVFGNTYDSGRNLIIYPGVANVAGNTISAVGIADRLRFEQVQREKIEFDEPKRTDAFREIQLQDPTDVMVVTYGDGGWQDTGQAFEFANSSRAPIIFVCENNGVAIGTEHSEVTAEPEMWKKGHGAGIPGVRVEATDFDGMFLASRFAAIRASLDGGPTNLELMTERLVSHSSHHGHHLVAQMTERVREILDQQLANPEIKIDADAITEFKDKKLFAGTRFDTTILLKRRLTEFLRSTTLDEDRRREIQGIVDSIFDPSEEVITAWIAVGIIGEEEWREIIRKAKIAADAVAEEVSGRSKPIPDVVGKFIRADAAKITIGEQNNSEEILTMDAAEAERTAILEAMRENPGLVVGGVDIYAGPDIGKSGNAYIIRDKGGYFHQLDGIWKEFGKKPGRFWNLPIAEMGNVARWMGASTQPSYMIEADLDQQMRVLKGEMKPEEVILDRVIKRYIMDLEYGDYGIEAFRSWWINGGIYQTTSGQIIRPFGVILPCAMVDGGGAMHSHSVEAIVNQVPEGVSLYTVSDPQTLYELLRYTLRFENNPYVIVLDRKQYNLPKGEIPTWRKGEGFFEPGRDRIVQEGKDLQIITWGPMTTFVKKAVARVQEKYPQAKIGLLDKVSWRPDKSDDLEKFLSGGKGPVIVATEDFRRRSLGNQIITNLVTSESLKPHVLGQGRDIQYLSSADVSHPYCDGKLMAKLRPTVDSLSQVFDEALKAELEKQKAQI